MNGKMRGNGAAKSAVMAALYDLMGKRLGKPLYQLWGLDPAKAPKISLHDRHRRRAGAARQAPRGEGLSRS